MPSTQEGLSVRYLNDPRPCRTLRAVKQDALSMDIQEHFLDKVIRLSSVSENSLADIPNKAGVPPKELSKCFAITCENLREKRFVQEIFCKLRNLRHNRRLRNRLQRWLHGRKSCRSRAHSGRFPQWHAIRWHKMTSILRRNILVNESR